MRKWWSLLITRLGVGATLLLPLLAHGQESVESQLAPPSSLQSEAPQPEAPTLPVENIDPSPHLPSIPNWIVLLSIIVVFALLALITFFVLNSRTPARPHKSRSNPLATAKESLLALRKLPKDTPLAEISTRISLIIRGYLAESTADQSLYQTREEFIASEDKLRDLPDLPREKVTLVLDELASLQYAPPKCDAELLDKLIEQGKTTLDAIASSASSHSAPATHNTPEPGPYPKQEDATSIIASLPKLAEAHRKMSKSNFGVELDYSAESLALLDKIIDEHFPKKQAPAMDTTLLTFGAYVGETIRRLLGGEWEETDNHELALNKVGGIAQLFPMNKTRKRFENGIEDSLADFYVAVRHIIEKPQAKNPNQRPSSDD